MSTFLSFFFFLSILLLAYSFLFILNYTRIEKGFDFSNKAGLPIICAICLGWILLQFSTYMPLINKSSFTLGLYPFILASFALSLYGVQKSIGGRFLTILIICALSVVFLPENLLVFGGLLPFILDRLITAILWALFISAYTTMDKITGLTVNQTCALCLAFSLAPMVNIDGNFLFSPDFSFYPLFIIAALLAFMQFKKKVPDLSLGRAGAIPLGYLMGLFLIILTTKGLYWVAIVMPAYYYFEIIYSRINMLIHKKKPQPKIFTFFISKIIRENLGSQKILSFLFFMMLGFSLIGLFYGNLFNLSMSLVGCLMLCLIYRFLHWGTPRVTYRAMFKDTKDLSILVWDNMKQTAKDVSESIKKKK